MRVLIVEDDTPLAAALQRTLGEAGMVTDWCRDGREAEVVGATEPYDAAVLDLGLPGRDGFAVLRHWREQGVTWPVLVLTARSRWHDKRAGFEAGADDYLTKPFLHEELVLRLRALQRRAYGRPAPLQQAGPLVLDTAAQRFTLAGEPLSLTAQEHRILAYLMARQGELVSRLDLHDHVYGRDLDPDSNSLDVLIGRIRRKLGRPLIETERGRGWRLVVPPDRRAAADAADAADASDAADAASAPD